MLWWIAETTVVAGALAAVAALASRFGRLGPASRHAIWAVVLVKLVTPPFVHAPWAVSRPDASPAAPEALIVPAELVEVERARSPDRPPESKRVGEIAEQFRMVLRLTTAPAPMAISAPVAPAELAPAELAPSEPTPPQAPPAPRPSLPTPSWWWLGMAWAGGSVTVAGVQVSRMLKFSARVRSAPTAPAWIVAETRRMADKLNVRAPEARVVEGLGAPVLWCLGRPKLLIPARLIKTMGAERWRGVLAHELAHLRRGDPWFSRLALVAGWAWWWSPVYRIARRRMEAEAELACDAWALMTLPERGDRVAYAGTMVDICARLNGADVPAPPLAPALGTSGSGRLLERRIRMILNDNVACRLSLSGALAPALLLLVGLPSWTVAGDDKPGATSESKSTATTTVDGKTVTLETVVIDGKPTITLQRQGEKSPESKPVRVRAFAVEGKPAQITIGTDDDPVARKLESKTIVVRAQGEDARAKAIAGLKNASEKLKSKESELKERLGSLTVKAGDDPNDKEQAEIEKLRANLARAKAESEHLNQVIERLKSDAPRVLRKIEATVEEDDSKPRGPLQLRLRKQDRRNAAAAEVEARKLDDDDDDDDKDDEKHEIEIEISELSELSRLFSPDSELMKGLETLGPALAKAFQENFGEGTEFESRMKGLGAKIEAEVKEKLGPGSEFEKAMKELAGSLEKTLGPGSEFETRIKALVEEFEKGRESLEGAEKEVRVEVKKRIEEAEDAAKAEAEKARAAGEDVRVEIKKRLETTRDDARVAAEKAKARASEAHIRALEAQIEALSRQVKELRNADKD